MSILTDCLMWTAARSHLPRRTIRLRLTAIYGGLFLLSGAGLLAVTYILVQHATGTSIPIGGKADNGVSAVQGASSGNTNFAWASRDGMLQILNQQQAQEVGKQLKAVADNQRTHQMHQLLIQSGVALALMSMLSIALGWIVAGRVLRPLRTITDVAHTISATNLHQRLALAGPDDELKKLGDTFDALLGRLEGAFDAQRRFVANASHELRTPLTLVRALLQMTLTDPHADLDSFRTTCRDVLAEGEHQERLIEALLVLARSERGLDHREPINLAAIADEVLTARRGEAERLGLRIEVSARSARTDGDIRLAERLVSNLIDNALRHNIAGGRVSVRTGIAAGRPFVSVTNTGPQVAAADIARLLQPFQRLGADSTNHGDGLGLGLSIVAAIAGAHDATLTVEPRPGGGLHITASFPPARADNSPESTMAPAQYRDHCGLESTPNQSPASSGGR